LTFDQYHEHRKDFRAKRDGLMRDVAGGQGGITDESWQGYTGKRSFGLFIGERHDGDIIRASGVEAKTLERWCKANGWRPKCTRIDLQITARIDKVPQQFASRVAKAARASAANGPGGSCRKIAAYQNGAASTGLTLGSRSSGRYCRFYDKTAEQKQRVEEGLWRFEVEFKNQQAANMFLMLMSAVNGYYLALSVVKTTFEMHGVNMPWVRQGEKVELPSYYRQNDDDRRLLWLETHVRGTVQKLIKAGKLEEVKAALGL
jgi:DNA relaxase NicK